MHSTCHSGASSYYSLYYQDSLRNIIGHKKSPVDTCYLLGLILIRYFFLNVWRSYAELFPRQESHNGVRLFLGKSFASSDLAYGLYHFVSVEDCYSEQNSCRCDECCCHDCLCFFWFRHPSVHDSMAGRIGAHQSLWRDWEALVASGPIAEINCYP